MAAFSFPILSIIFAPFRLISFATILSYHQLVSCATIILYIRKAEIDYGLFLRSTTFQERPFSHFVLMKAVGWVTAKQILRTSVQAPWCIRAWLYEAEMLRAPKKIWLLG
jgi:hypothetical protein